MTDAENKMIALLWDHLKRDPDHEDRRQTGYGTKTRVGLVACINRIHDGAGADLADDELPDQVPANPYNDKFDADEQIAAEKRIAAYLRECLGGSLDDESAAALGRDILVMTLEHFRKDLFHKESS